MADTELLADGVPWFGVAETVGGEQNFHHWELAFVEVLELAREHLPGPAWDKLLRSTMLVISERIQHHLQRRGAGRVVRSDGPGNADLLRAVLRLAEGAGET